MHSADACRLLNISKHIFMHARDVMFICCQLQSMIVGMFTKRIHLTAKCGIRKISSFKGKEYKSKLEKDFFNACFYTGARKTFEGQACIMLISQIV